MITAGKMAGLAHEKDVWGTLWDQEHSKSEALEERYNHQISELPLESAIIC